MGLFEPSESDSGAFPPVIKRKVCVLSTSLELDLGQDRIQARTLDFELGLQSSLESCVAGTIKIDLIYLSGPNISSLYDRNLADRPFIQQYFSTLGRVRLAQAPAPRTTSRCWYCDHESVRSFKATPRPSLSRNSNYLRSPSGRRLQKTPSPEHDFSQADAQWFLSLPETVQRKHFTREEQRLLAGHCESIIVDVTDRALYRLGRQVNRSVPTLGTSYSTETSTSSPYSLELEDQADPVVDMNASLMDNFRWMEDDSGLDLTFDDYHKHIVDTAKPATKAVTQKPSFRRSLSLSNVPFCGNLSPSTSKFQGAMTSTQLPRPTARDQYERTCRPQRTDALRVATKLGSEAAIDLTANHYQDPETRLKLQEYLGSIQKFDEVIEFGFPALEEKMNAVRRPSLSGRYKTAPPVLTFYDDDTVSLHDTHGDADNTAGLPEEKPSGNPLKDTMANEPNYQHPSKQTSADYENVLPESDTQPNPTEPRTRFLPGSREMTLRMTLNRPNLRANKSAQYAEGDDPLALAQLPPVTRDHNIWDSAPKNSGTVRKLWRKVSGGPRL